jgi:pimeloyl-ACP methyl ester carboxylesterase
MNTTKTVTPSIDGANAAANQFVDAANGVTYAYRRVGASTAAPPLVLLQHFRGTMDDWDPLLVDRLAQRREVILFDNTGVGLSSGNTPPNITAMARDAIAFFDALSLGEVDVLGYSIGGMIAQELALLRPRQVRRLILAATGPQGGGQEMHGWIVDVEKVANQENNGAAELVWLFFNPTQSSRERGNEFLARVFSRQAERDKPVTPESWRAQYDAVVEWGIPDKSKLNRLAGIRQPTLVTNGDNDTMIPPVNTHILAEHLPNARVRFFPDAGHGFLFQWPVEFASLVDDFLK